MVAYYETLQGVFSNQSSLTRRFIPRRVGAPLRIVRQKVEREFENFFGITLSEILFPLVLVSNWRVHSLEKIAFFSKIFLHFSRINFKKKEIMISTELQKFTF
jgi:hypothetical protein